MVSGCYFIRAVNLDPKRFDPKKIKRAISNAKNQCFTSNELEEKAGDHFEKIVAEAYKRYRISLSKNNALDFDDLLLLPVFLLRQNDFVRDYWHKRFQHILVDEYQDTNRTQYELIKLITAGNTEPQKTKDCAQHCAHVVKCGSTQRIRLTNPWKKKEPFKEF